MNVAKRQSFDLAEVRKLARSSSDARLILEHFAQRAKANGKTVVSGLQTGLRNEGHNVGPTEIRDVLKALAAAGCGAFVLGRHGAPSRLEWTVNLIDVGKAATGAAVPVRSLENPVAEAAAENDGGLPMQHRFRLRRDFEIRFELPADFTAAEAGRVGDFIKTIPFG